MRRKYKRLKMLIQLVALALLVAPWLCVGEYMISTIAGTGGAGYSGDGSSGTSAALNFPTTIALDSTGIPSTPP